MDSGRKYTLLILGLFILGVFNSGCGNSSDISSDTSTEKQSDSIIDYQAFNEQDAVENITQPDTVDFDWCAEHFVPESRCTKCNPSLIAGFKESGDWCPPHELPESNCRLCNPEIQFPQETILKNRALAIAEDAIEVSLFFRPNSNFCATNDALIQFASADIVSRSGITTELVRASDWETLIEAPAEVVFDESRSTVTTSTVSALVSRWMVSPGDEVETGTPLAILQSPEIARLKAELLSADASYSMHDKELSRFKQLRENKLISASEYEHQLSVTEHARSDFMSAQGLLLSAGVSSSDILDLLASGIITNTFTLHATRGGIVIDRIAQLGELLEAGRAFAVLADPSAMWIEAQLTEEQIRQVSPGQTLTFSADGRGQARIGAEIIWVSKFLDPQTRTGIVRANVIDPSHKLQAGEFGRVSIVNTNKSSATLVNKNAVQWEGCCNVVFVKETSNRFRPRKVDIHDGNGMYYQVLNNLEAGEEVVVNGAFLLKTELKKSSIGAGCCGIEPAG